MLGYPLASNGGDWSGVANEQHARHAGRTTAALARPGPRQVAAARGRVAPAPPPPAACLPYVLPSVRAEPPAAEPPAPQRRGPSVAAVTEALARDSVDDRDAETHLTRCILRAALRRKLRRRDRKAAELKMNEFMRATRRVGRGKC